jgi:hypothetical protein
MNGTAEAEAQCEHGGPSCAAVGAPGVNPRNQRRAIAEKRPDGDEDSGRTRQGHTTLRVAATPTARGGREAGLDRAVTHRRLQKKRQEEGDGEGGWRG